MPTRSFADAGQFNMTDLTPELVNVPNTWGLFQQLGIFNNNSVSQYNITLEQIDKVIGVLTDTARGGRPLAGKDYDRLIRSYSMPQFKAIDQITPNDVQGVRAYASDGVETVDLALARKIEFARKSQALTLEVARAQLINDGTVYAPNNNVAPVNFYTDFGVIRVDVNFELDDPSTNVIAKVEDVIAAIQDNLNAGDIVSDIVGVVSPGFFNALISQATIVEAYKYYASQEEPLRRRLSAVGLDARYRSFYYAGILFIEYRGTHPTLGTPFITANEARFFPVDASGLFETYFGPAFKFGYENTLGEEGYLWTYPDPKGGSIDIEYETNFINILRRPQAIVRGTAT